MTIRFFRDASGGASGDFVLLLAGALTAGLVLVPALAEAPQAALAAALANLHPVQGPDPEARAPTCKGALPGTCP